MLFHLLGALEQALPLPAQPWGLDWLALMLTPPLFLEIASFTIVLGLKAVYYGSRSHRQRFLDFLAFVILLMGQLIELFPVFH